MYTRRKRERTARAFAAVSTTTAMIDVIFILLAFFLSVSQIKKSTVKVELPEVSEAVATGERIDDRLPVRKIIQLSSEGSLYLGDRRMGSAAELFSEFDSETAADSEAGRPIVVEIISDRQAGTGVLVDVINYLTKKKVKRLEFLAVEKESAGSD